MPEKGVISPFQLFILLFLFDIGTSTLFGPYLVTAAAKQDAWISILVGTCVMLLLLGIYVLLIKRYSSLTLVEMSEKILGKWVGKGLSFLFFVYFFILTSGLIRIEGDFITTHILPETPIEAIEIIFMLIVVYGTRHGLEVFTRTAEMVLPWVLMFFFLLIFFLFPEIEFTNLFPLMEDGIRPVMRGSYLSLGVPFLDIVIFLMITPYVTPAKKIGRTLAYGTLAGGLIFFFIVMMSILVLGPNQTAQLNYPIYVLAQKVNIGNFIQRIEVLAGGIVFISIFIKTTISFYSLSLSLAQILHLQNYKMLSFPFGIMIILFANLMSPNIIFFHKFLFTSWTPISLIFGILFPFLLLGIDTIKTGVKI